MANLSALFLRFFNPNIFPYCSQYPRGMLWINYLLCMQEKVEDCSSVEGVLGIGTHLPPLCKLSLVAELHGHSGSQWVNGRQGRSRRKIKPTPPQSEHQPEMVHEELLSLQQHCKPKGQPSPHACMRSSWLNAEYLIPDSDIPFVHEKPMQKVMAELNLSRQQRVRKYEEIKRCLPKPALFQAAFLNQQRVQLQQVRKTSTIPLFQGGQKVWAYHPTCSHVHLGTVLAHYKGSVFLVKFALPHLGTHKLSHSAICSVKPCSPSLPLISSPIKLMRTDISLEVMGAYFLLLQAQKQMITCLRSYNRRAEQLKVEGKILSPAEVQEFGWAGSTFCLITVVLNFMQGNFPLTSSLSPAQPSIPALIPNQLYTKDEFMPPLQQNGDNVPSGNGQNGRVHEIRRIIQNSVGVAQTAFKPAQQHKTSQVDDLVVNLIGVLFELAEKGTQYSSKSDPYMQQIRGNFRHKYPNQVREIGEKVEKIAGKK